MKTKLVLIRHAEAEGNYKRLFQGWTDGDLTEKGHIQAEIIARRVKDMDIDVLYASSLKRTMETARYISEIKKLPIIKTDKLKEIFGGDWENVPWDLLPHKWPSEYESWEKEPHNHRMPNGESMAEFYHRLVMEIERILEENQGKCVCIVTHGTAIRALMCYIKGCSLEEMINIDWYENTSVTIVEYENGVFNLLVEGDASHIGKELRTIENQDWWIEKKRG